MVLNCDAVRSPPLLDLRGSQGNSPLEIRKLNWYLREEAPFNARNYVITRGEEGALRKRFEPGVAWRRVKKYRPVRGRKRRVCTLRSANERKQPLCTSRDRSNAKLIRSVRHDYIEGDFYQVNN